MKTANNARGLIPDKPTQINWLILAFNTTTISFKMQRATNTTVFLCFVLDKIACKQLQEGSRNPLTSVP